MLDPPGPRLERLGAESGGPSKPLPSVPSSSAHEEKDRAKRTRSIPDKKTGFSFISISGRRADQHFAEVLSASWPSVENSALNHVYHPWHNDHAQFKVVGLSSHFLS